MRALVLCSGGVDSTTLLAKMVKDLGAEQVQALSVFYGQRHDRELLSARAVAEHYGVQLTEMNLAGIFAQSDCSLLKNSSQEIPLESYASQQAGERNAPVSTYVPFRNGLFLSAAASVALSNDCQMLCYGAHSDDWAGSAYPDCSPAFVEAMGRAISEGTGGAVRLEAPFVNWNKAKIVALGLSLKVPYEKTWSCYNGGEVPCGQCATCIDRMRAFAKNAVKDPLLERAQEAGR